MASERKDAWARGNEYEPYVGRCSRLVAREFVNWIDVPANGEWLDVGCGTGALCEAILQTASRRRVTGIDPSKGFISFAQHKSPDRRVTFQVGDAQAHPAGRSRVHPR
jgi:ubiquinone/menaquinone biosynthesis C-methylase UbiE